MIKEKNMKGSRSIYRSSNPISGIDIEILHYKDHRIIYLQVHSEPLLPLKEAQNKIEVIFYIRNEKKIFLSDIHQGKQRIRLSEEAQAELLSALNSGDPFIIEFSNYQEYFYYNLNNKHN